MPTPSTTNGYDIHVVVSPDDCATCHAVEREQYAKNIMAMAHTNLADNELYNDLERTILGRSTQREGRHSLQPGRSIDSGRSDATTATAPGWSWPAPNGATPMPAKWNFR
jgi:hypothetical protein